MTDGQSLTESNQEQAVAAWVGHLNQLRLNALLNALDRHGQNLDEALSALREARHKIDVEVVTTNRGGLKGMHGFIAEVAEVGIGNARRRVLGKPDGYQWVNDNGPVDLIRDGVAIQQKFVASGGRYGLGAIQEHLQKYPDYLANGGSYQIPSDHFDVVRQLHTMSREEATSLTSAGSGPSFRDWERVQAFFDSGSVSFESIEPSHLTYSEAQRGAIDATLAAEEESVCSTSRALRDDAYQRGRPSAPEATKAAAGAAIAEGCTAFVMALLAKRRAGKRLADLTHDDWADIAGDTGFGGMKGGVRGVSIYTLTNFTATPTAVASSIVTAAFGVAEQANRMRRGEIGETEFIEIAEFVCLETAVSALSSFAGQALIPVPVLGAVVGNTVGMILYKSVSASLSTREASLIERYLSEQQALDDRFAAEYAVLIEDLAVGLSYYLDLLDRAFSPDVDLALRGSVVLAREMGVAAEDILDTDEKTLAYFRD